MLLLPLKIIAWIGLVRVSIVTGRWSVWLGLAAATAFTLFDGAVVWQTEMVMLWAAYWVVATATLAGFNRCESLFARALIMSAGSFLLILGPLLIPTCLRSR